MATALTQLKGFIQTYSGYNFEDVSESEKDALKQFVAQSFRDIRWEVDTDLEQIDDLIQKKQYLSNLQSQLAYFASGLNGFEQESESDHPTTPILKWILCEIFSVLEHLRNHFSQYFDLDLKLPQHFIANYKETHPEVGLNVKNVLDALNIDQELKSLIVDYCNATESTEKFKIVTWQQFDYQLTIVQAIENLGKDPEQENPNLELLKLFVGHEFNSIQIYGYIIKFIEKTTLGDSSFQEQQQEILYLLKVFRQVRIDAYYPYDPKIQSLKLSVIESLETELTYLEQKEKLMVQNFKGKNPDEPTKFYFKVAVTLAELMFFFRVMLEVKVIFTKFNSYLYEFISNHIQTDRAENISKKSMRNHFNNKPFPDRVVQNVKSWLEKMIQHINLYYNV